MNVPYIIDCSVKKKIEVFEGCFCRKKVIYDKLGRMGGESMRRKMQALFQNGDKDTFAHAE